MTDEIKCMGTSQTQFTFGVSMSQVSSALLVFDQTPQIDSSDRSTSKIRPLWKPARPTRLRRAMQVRTLANHAPALRQHSSTYRPQVRSLRAYHSAETPTFDTV